MTAGPFGPQGDRRARIEPFDSDSSGRVYRGLDITAYPDKRGFLGYLFLFKLISSSASLSGYGQFLSGTARRWK
jgi:hypothetical protein